MRFAIHTALLTTAMLLPGCTGPTALAIQLSAAPGVGIASLFVQVGIDGTATRASRSVPPNGGRPTLPGRVWVRLPDVTSAVTVVLVATTDSGSGLTVETHAVCPPHQETGLEIVLGAAAADLGAPDGPGSDGSPPARWTPVPAPTGAFFKGVWGSGPNDVYVGGTGGFMIHFLGPGAYTKTLLGAPVLPSLFAVWGSGPNDVFTVGSGGHVFHSRGSDIWTPQQTTPAVELRSVWGSASNDVYAVGQAGVALRYDGSVWSQIAVGSADSLNGVWSASVNDVFIVDGAARVLRSKPGGFVQEASIGQALTGIWGSSLTDLWAVGASEIWSSRGDGTWISALPIRSLHAVGGSGPTDVYAVGAGGAVFHFDGTNWRSEDSGVTTQLNGVWASGPNDVWIVGDDGLVLHGP